MISSSQWTQKVLIKTGTSSGEEGGAVDGDDAELPGAPGQVGIAVANPGFAVEGLNVIKDFVIIFYTKKKKFLCTYKRIFSNACKHDYVIIKIWQSRLYIVTIEQRSTS